MRLLLDIFTIQFTPRGGKGENAKKPISCKQIYDECKSIDESRHGLFVLLERIVSTFDNSFILNSDNTKAVSFGKGANTSISTEGQYIVGRFRGGNTGSEYDVYSNGDDTQSTHTIKPTEVTTQEFMFYLWMPRDFSTAVLLLQRYSNSTCVAMIKKRLNDVFKDMGFNPHYAKMVPSWHRESFLEDCTIYAIDVKHSTDLEDGMNPKVNLLKRGKWSSKFTNLAIEAKKIAEDKALQRKLTNEIAEIDSSFDSTKDKLIFHYVDTKQQKASSTIEELECLLPSVNLPDICIQDNTPNWVEVENVCKSYLEFIKQDLKYS